MLVRENLLLARKRKKLSQRELGEMIGLSGGIIGLYETGVRSPRPATLRQLAEALDVDVEWLEAKEDNNQLGAAGVDSIFELVNLLENPEKERKFLSSYSRLTLALTELTRAVEARKKLDDDETPAEAELEALQKIEMVAKSCCDYFSDMQDAFPTGFTGVKESFGQWQKDKQKFDDLLQEYLKLNTKGRKIIVNTATALAATSDYRRSIERDVSGGANWRTVRQYLTNTRMERNMTLQEVSDSCKENGLSDLNEKRIHDIEEGTCTPSAKELCYLADALDVRLTDFLPYGDR